MFQRYRFIRCEEFNLPVSSIAKQISGEIIEIWKRTSIPHKSLKAVIKSVERLIERWNKVRPENRTDEEMQNTLDSLFDIRPANLLTDVSLQLHLKTFFSSSWEEEFTFFAAGQIQHPQSTSMSTTTDNMKKQKDEMK